MKRLVLAASAVAVLTLCVTVSAEHPSPARADTSDPTAPTVTVTPTTGLSDGQMVSITITAPVGTSMASGYAVQCRGGTGVSYPDDGNHPETAGDKDCPLNPISSTAAATGNAGLVFEAGSFLVKATDPGGDTFSYAVGTGTSQPWLDFTTSPPSQASLTCDEQNPCVLLVALQYQPPGGQLRWKPYPIPLQFGGADPITACGGAASGALSSAGSDRMLDAWVQWTLAACRLPGAHGAPSHATFLGEGNAVDQIGATNLVDVAYTAGGYDDAMALAVPPDPTAPDGGRRAVVAVPIAVSAAGVATAEGIPIAPHHIQPYTGVDLKATWAAAMLSGGAEGTVDIQNDVLQANPGLNSLYSFAVVPVQARAGSDAASWVLTNYFHELAGDAWVVPNRGSFQTIAGQPRVVSADLATATPNFVGDFTALASGRPAFQQAVTKGIPTGGTQAGPIWLFSDLTTALAVGGQPVAITDAKGDFVPPNPANLLAAVKLMKEDPYGILVGDPGAVAPAGETEAYPLTMVEYAVVPAEPLKNDDCTSRTQSQQLLHDWLTFITSDAGQALLPDGMVALPPELRATAAQRIEKVGTAAVTGACADSTRAPAPAGSDVGGSGTGSAAAGSPLVSVGTSITGSASPVGTGTADSASGASTAPPSSSDTELVSVPAFAGTSGSSSTGVVVALLGILAATVLAAKTTARSP